MQRYKVPLLLLFIIILILILHLGGSYLHFYWRFSFYDRIVHTLASFWVALTVLTLLERVGVKFVYKRNIFIMGICLTLIVGICWEFFEYGIGQTSVSDPKFIGDTLGDIFFDVVGGSIGSYYGIKLLTIWNNQKGQ